MQLLIERLDIDKTRENWRSNQPFRPAFVKPRKQDKRHWLVLTEPFLPGDEPHFAKTTHDEYVRIPLYPYRLSPQGDLALAFMLQLGLSCASYLPAAIESLYLVVGNPVHILYDAEDPPAAIGMQYWIGVALTLEKTNG